MARKHEPTPRIVYRSPDGRVEIIRDGGDFYLTIDGNWAGCYRSEGAALVEATIRLGELAGLVYIVSAAGAYKSGRSNQSWQSSI